MLNTVNHPVPIDLVHLSRFRERLYLTLTLIGSAVPIYLLDTYFIHHGLAGMFQDIFANGASAAVAADLLLSSLVFWFLVAQEMNRLQTGKGKLPVFILINLFVGLSSALPAFLWWRERQCRKQAADASNKVLG